jgi:endogenous inhibitor of DNA gyrase (YacG/DUF329 family)
MTLRVPCPNCGKDTTADEKKPLPKWFPFCSERCKLLDLGKWADGSYRISRAARPGEAEPSGGDEG